MTDARARGEHYLLERRMLRSLSSGEVIDRRWTRFSFPVVWHYDVLRGLDYLRSAGVKPDERVAEAVALVEERRHQNGRWPLNGLHADPRPAAFRHGDRGRQGQPLEHAARLARAGLGVSGPAERIHLRPRGGDSAAWRRSSSE